MRALTPAEVLFEGVAPPAILPVCDHYAGSEKLMLKSLALQAQLGPVFDITLDCEDGAEVGREAAHAELVASLVGSERDRESAQLGRVGIRIHDFRHPHWRDDVRIILRAAARAPAYITLPKIRSVADAAEMCAFIEATRRELGIAQPIPVQLLIETHGALAQAFALAALPAVEALSFGLMDFVSAHDGAIPDTAMRSPGQFDHPLVRRAKLEIAAACHAHGKVPSHNVSTEVRDMSVVANDAARARNEFGYTRMWSIHPAQIPPIVAAFAPRDEEIETAAEILLAAQAAQWGPTRYGDTLHDRASYRYYWSVLRRAGSTGRALPPESAPLFGADPSSEETAR
jgi:citrate lyase subunit beta/citryl-CoA lyase